MDLTAGGYELEGLARVNVVLGKNGCGKSTVLKAVETGLAGQPGFGRLKYVTPERGGVLVYEPNIEHSMTSDASWMPNTRRGNQAGQFRQQSVAQFRKLEISVLRASEGRAIANFQPHVDRLNGLLDNVELRRNDLTFAIHSRHTSEPVQPSNISSGESELISLGIEMLMFAHELDDGAKNVIFLDEPDVHLHPDLQTRLVAFLTKLADEYEFTVLIATHSTAMLGGLSGYGEATVAFMRWGDRRLVFESISEVHRRVLPVFGAHPLSNVFNASPVLIVEGDDDVRVWQQAVRTSEGKVNLYPVPCSGVSSINAYETDVARIVDCVYDNARAFSLRDGDDHPEPLDDLPPVTRIRLACRASENLLLSDEVLASMNLGWTDVVARMERWIEANSGHERHADMLAFKNDEFDRKGHNLKDLRMLLVGQILGSSKPWEVLVGRVVGDYVCPVGDKPVSPGSLADFLGDKAVRCLCRH